MRIPPADQIEIVRAEDPPPLPWPVPDMTPLSELDLTTRARSTLRGYQRYESSSEDWGLRVVLTTVGDLRSESDRSLLLQPNCGRKTVKELREACGDDFPYTKKHYRLTLAEAVGPDKAGIIIVMRAAATQLQGLADLIEQAARKGSL